MPEKKIAAKQAVAKKAPAKKTAAKKATAKKATAKKVTAKRAPAKKAPAKKAPAKQAPAKKALVKKAPAKKAPAKKAPAVAKKTAKKAPGKKAAVKSAAAKAAPTAPTLDEKATALAVREDESPWSSDELREVYDDLNAHAVRLRGELATAEAELADLLRDGGEGAGDDQADAGSKTFEREHEMSLAANARDLLSQTEHAMDRIKLGTYGTCEGCGRPIGKARLQAYPRATLCVSCKQREERR
jgi:RNA polymerase-binding protein DksA